MSILDPVDRLGWLEAVAALEDAGEPVTAFALAALLRQRRAHTRRMLAKLRDEGVLCGVERVRLAARGRWYLGRPVLVYLAAALDPAEPWATAADAIAGAVDLVAGIGAPAAVLMPTVDTLASAAAGNARAASAIIAIAVRADVVVVDAADPLLELRPDVVAAQRVDALVTVEPRDRAASAVRESLARGGQRP